MLMNITKTAISRFQYYSLFES